ncbi:MAG TPA: LysM domain-containing protein, partial [Anaerolineales bacterium]|nr:LysM domain-containing protein [Anaerolineales bacterium]
MRGRKTVFVGAILLAGMGLTALFITAILLLNQLRGSAVTAAEVGPEVEILTPVSGARLLARDEQLVDVQAFADRPIQRYELWVDGRRQQRSDLDVTGTVPTDRTTFLWRPTSAGIAILVARAYDDLGRAATSSPRAVEILPWKPEDLLQGSYEVRPGDTLQTIAETFGLLSNDLAQANPGVPLSPPVGQVIQIPVPAGPLPEAYTGDDRQADPEPLDPPWSTSLTIGEAQPARSVEVPPAPAASAPPLGPEALEASASGGCSVVLRWTDRAETEAGFRLYRYGAPDMDFARVAEFAPNEQFDALTFTDQVRLVGNYQYYIAAWNGAGEAASPIRQVVVPSDGCPGTGETHLLQLEVLDLTTNQPLDRAYCYLSHEFAGREHDRLPEDEDAFLSVDEDGWNIEDYAAGPHRMIFTHDLDQPIPVAMECWGWAGAELVNLGSFRNSHPRSDWESVLPVRFTGAGEGFEAVYSIGPF